MKELLIVGAIVVLAISLRAEEPRTALKAPPRIGGRVVKELSLTARVWMGGGPVAPGGPIFPGNYMIKANRFVPVSEDPNFVYYQAEGNFREGSGEPGGLRMSKTYPDQVYAYFGDGHYPKIKLSSWQTLLPGDVRKIRVHYADAGSTRKSAR